MPDHRLSVAAVPASALLWQLARERNELPKLRPRKLGVLKCVIVAVTLAVGLLLSGRR